MSDAFELVGERRIGLIANRIEHILADTSFASEPCVSPPLELGSPMCANRADCHLQHIRWE